MEPDKRINLEWTGEGLVFRGGAPDGPQITVDGDGSDGPTPMDSVLLGVAGCMGVDVRMILEKSRVEIQGLEVDTEAERAPEPPRRYTSLRIHFRVVGAGQEDESKIERAIQLSRDTYCSVLHSLQPDIPVEVGFERV